MNLRNILALLPDQTPKTSRLGFSSPPRHKM